MQGHAVFVHGVLGECGVNTKLNTREVIDMADYQCSLVLANEEEWLEHLRKVAASQDGKTEDEILEEAFTFDFKWDTILL